MPAVNPRTKIGNEQAVWAKLAEFSRILIMLNQCIPWDMFRKLLKSAKYEMGTMQDKSKAGAKPFDVVLMFKMLVLQRLYNLSDEQLEFQVWDRMTFKQFLGLTAEDRVPDARTIWRFKQLLSKKDLADKLFQKFDSYLTAAGMEAKGGQLIDATIVDTPRQRNHHDENDQIKVGEIPPEWKEEPAKLRQKDTDARWTKKHGKTHFGYKNHVNVDERSKLIRKFVVTSAAEADPNVMDELLDDNTDRAVYADSAYRSKAREADLVARGLKSRINEKGKVGCPLTKGQIRSNRAKSRHRSRVEHVFGFMASSMRFVIMRGIGIVRANATIAMTNLTYNLCRFSMLVFGRAKFKRIIPSAVT